MLFRAAGSEIKTCGQEKPRRLSTTQPTTPFPCKRNTSNLLAGVLHGGAASPGSRNNKPIPRPNHEGSVGQGRKRRGEDTVVVLITFARVPRKQGDGLAVDLWP